MLVPKLQFGNLFLIKLLLVMHTKRELQGTGSQASNSQYGLIWSAGILAGKNYNVSISLFTFHYLGRQGCRRSRWVAKMRIAVPKPELGNQPKYPLTLKTLSYRDNTMQYSVILEEGPTSFGAYVPDLPGCIAVGESREEAVQLIQEAIEFHLEEYKEEGTAFPFPHSSSEFVEIHL